jgi:hypothetical protein
MQLTPRKSKKMLFSVQNFLLLVFLVSVPLGRDTNGTLVSIILLLIKITLKKITLITMKEIEWLLLTAMLLDSLEASRIRENIC